FSFSFHCSRPLRHPPSFPTRRSSDLVGYSHLLAARKRKSPMTSMTLKALLEVLLGMQGTFVLCNAHGSLEFKGQDLYLSSYEERSEEHTSELQSRFDLVCRLLLEKKK